MNKALLSSNNDCQGAFEQGLCVVSARFLSSMPQMKDAQIFNIPGAAE